MGFPVTCSLCGITVQVTSRVHQARQRYCSRKCSGIARHQASVAANAATPKVKPSKPCRHCQRPFVPDYRAAVFCSRICASQWQAERMRNRAVEPFVTKERAEWLKQSDRERRAQKRVVARAYVAEVNARTVCAHCGAQPIEWHNPEHVNLNRQHYRIGRMVGIARSVEKIQQEMAACTPLCRRCHMKEDGRLIRNLAGGRKGRRR